MTSKRWENEMQAIQTFYLGPTASRGPRIKAKAQAGTVTLDWDDGLNPTDNHRRACAMLVDKYGWHYGVWIMGELPDGTGCWVCLDENGQSPRLNAG